MKRSRVWLFGGVRGILAALAGWFTTILGMKGESRYSRVLRSIVGTCFTVLFLIVTLAMLAEAFRCIYDRFGYDTGYELEDDGNQYLSRGLTYHNTGYDGDGYVFDCNGNKLITGISWIAKPLGRDSLVCYSNGRKRGYFNMYTGQVVVEPTYSHAWIFSDGLAAVDDNGLIKFIDAAGKVVIDKNMAYIPGMNGYVFHNGYCVVHGRGDDRFGLIDTKGNWALSPEYFNIIPVDSFWIVDRGGERALLGRGLKEVLPFMRADIDVYGRDIYVTKEDHTISKYDYNGVLIEDFYISDISRLLYDTDKVYRCESGEYDSEDGTYDCNGTEFVRGVASCLCYQAEYGWYGLMSTDGKVITGPMYSDITAVGSDLYLCKDGSGNGILLNSKGERAGHD